MTRRGRAARFDWWPSSDKPRTRMDGKRRGGTTGVRWWGGWPVAGWVEETGETEKRQSREGRGGQRPRWNEQRVRQGGMDNQRHKSAGLTGGQGRTSGESGEARRPAEETRSSAGRGGKNDAQREGRTSDR